MPEVPPAGIAVASFSAGYRKFFEVVPATTDALKDQNYRLRHEVYARELGWLPLRADGIERDASDRHSLHCLMRAVTSHAFVGCARLVLADPANPSAPLPFESVGSATLDRTVVDPARLDRRRIGEISRLAVVAQYRRRAGEAESAFTINDDFGIAPRIRLPYLTLGLYLALIAQARWHGIETLFALTEPTLAHSLGHLGIEVTRIGKPVEHHGEKIPAIIAVDQALADLTSFVRPFYDTIADEVARAMRATA